MWFTRVSIQNPVLATMVMLAFVVLGLFSYQRLKVDQFPDIEFPVVVVQVDYPGASPEIVETEVTKKVEEAVNSIAGINKALGQFLSTVETREQIEQGAYAIVGSPATVRDKLTEYIKRLGVGNLLGLFQLGTLPADLTQKNMTLFANEVMPALRKTFGGNLQIAAPGAK